MTQAPEIPTSHTDRLAAMINYGLMAAAPFTLGVLAIVALLVAYLRRGRADPISRSHYEQQIRNFWTDLMVLGIGFICGWGALAAGVGAALEAMGVPLPGYYSAVHIGVGAFVLGGLWLLFWAWGFFGLVFGSITGAMRLASGRPASKTRGL